MKSNYQDRWDKPSQGKEGATSDEGVTNDDLQLRCI